ncbi:MAG TPA: VPDSG-CTERM sorting domain-containing protein [Opitutaceae bacterium]|jgi:hypothetical protein|nr:VPDSG-CTERM sorting domain-containing protein [Opitutaceae bacterium]
MNYSNIKTLAVLTAAFALGSIAKADPVVGGIDFGNIGTPGVSLSQVDANSYDLTFVNTQITGVGGPTFTGITVPSNPGGSISFATILLTGTSPNFSGAGLTDPSENGGDLWTFTSGASTFSFIASSFVVTPDGGANPGWLISGTGIFQATGYTDTPGTYSLDFSANGITGFASTNFANVPDSGTTVALLGLGLLAVGAYAFRSKLSKA